MRPVEPAAANPTPPGLGDEEFEAWFRLLATPGLGRAGARRLLAACGSPERALAAPPSLWRDVAGAAALQGHLAGPDPETASRWQAALAWRHAGEARHVLALGDPRFPASLLETADPPLLLYVQGDPAWLLRRSIAIVGSRSPTRQGQEHAQDFARTLADAGWSVVSGLALGIDAAAHEGALASVAARVPDGGSTVAVVATGVDRVYPRRHHDLAHRVAAAGALVSEFAPGVPAMARHFPQRNRLIAGLSQGTLVVEAALQSGSLITARMASEAGREVFALPGAVNSPLARGCHALIKQGAKLVESAADVLEELTPALRSLRPTTASPAERAATPSAEAESAGAVASEDPILAALGHAPATLDSLMARTGFGAAELSARLLELELLGQVERRPGGQYQATRRG
jgi:DNA processing protein